MPELSVVIITRNKTARIRRCLESVAWAGEIIVVDPGSTDGMAAVCGEYTSKIYRRAFDTFDRQKNFGPELASGQWTLSLDADEGVSPPLRKEVQATLARDGDGRGGFLLQRQNYLCGHPLVHTWGQDALVRLVRRGRGRFQGTIHELPQSEASP